MEKLKSSRLVTKIFKFTNPQWKSLEISTFIAQQFGNLQIQRLTTEKFGKLQILSGKIWKFPDLQQKNLEFSNPVHKNLEAYKSILKKSGNFQIY